MVVAWLRDLLLCWAVSLRVLHPRLPKAEGVVRAPRSSLPPRGAQAEQALSQERHRAQPLLHSLVLQTLHRHRENCVCVSVCVCLSVSVCVCVCVCVCTFITLHKRINALYLKRTFTFTCTFTRPTNIPCSLDWLCCTCVCCSRIDCPPPLDTVCMYYDVQYSSVYIRTYVCVCLGCHATLLVLINQ